MSEQVGSINGHEPPLNNNGYDSFTASTNTLGDGRLPPILNGPFTQQGAPSPIYPSYFYTQTPPVAGSSSQARRFSEAAGSGNGPNKTVKRKSMPDSPMVEGPDSPDDDGRKRLKTPRACDPCRRKKIRCDVLPDSNPPICKHCRQHGSDCTFYLPITETRWKRRKNDEEEPILPHALPVAQQRSVSRPLPLPVPSMMPPPPIGTPRSSPNILPSPLAAENRVLGPTSMSYLMHSMSTFPIDRMQEYDSKHLVRCSQNDEGLIQLHQPELAPLHSGGRLPHGLQRLDPALVDELVNRYFGLHALIFPIITKSELLWTREMPPLLLEIICGMSLASNQYQPEHLKVVKTNIQLLSRDEEFLTRSSMQSVTMLLLYGFTFELERGMVGSRVWNMLGAAIRMAYDLGLHREYTSLAERDISVNVSERRRRTWAGLVIADRWLSAIYGLPMNIDLSDSDRHYPSNFDLQPGQVEADMDPETQPFLPFNKLLELSILLGQVLKLAYTPMGILNLTDEAAKKLEEDIYSWRNSLPDNLKIESQTPAPAAGYLNLLSIPVLFLFCRPFMRISFTCERLTYAFGMENWTDMVQRSAMAIEWASQNLFSIESWCPGLYSLFICALLQYHMHVRTGNATHLESLKLAAQTLEYTHNEECIARKKVREIVGLLLRTAESVRTWKEAPGRRGMNPTKGVTMRPREPNVRWDEKIRAYISNDNGDFVEPPTSYTAATGPSPSASTPTSDVRSTSRPEEAAIPAPDPSPAQPGPPVNEADGLPLTWRSGLPNVNPQLNLPPEPPYMLEPSLDVMAFGQSDEVPPYDASFFPDQLLDVNSWESFFDAAQPDGNVFAANGTVGRE